MIEYARYAVRAVGITAFLALMVFNVDVMGPRGAQATASSGTAECDLCEGYQQQCAVYCFPGGDCEADFSNEDPIAITPGKE